MLGKNLKRHKEPTSIQSSKEKGEKIVKWSLSSSISPQYVEKMFEQNSAKKLDVHPPPPLIKHFQEQQVLYSQLWKPLVMEAYTYEEPFWPPPPLPSIASYLGIHHTQSSKASRVEHTSLSISHLAKLEGIHNEEPYVRAYATIYGRKPLFDEHFSIKSSWRL